MPAATGRIYFDHNATSVVLPAARQAVLDAMDMPGNPSSIHAEGRAAKAVLEKARDAVAALCGEKDEAPEAVPFMREFAALTSDQRKAVLDLVRVMRRCS